jgi:hypothetical protein
VLNHFNIVRYIGIGVGLGANVLVRHALGRPNLIIFFILINLKLSTLITGTFLFFMMSTDIKPSLEINAGFLRQKSLKKMAHSGFAQ